MKKITRELKLLAKEKIKAYEFLIKFGVDLKLDKLKLECWKLLFKLLGGKF